MKSKISRNKCTTDLPRLMKSKNGDVYLINSVSRTTANALEGVALHLEDYEHQLFKIGDICKNLDSSNFEDFTGELSLQN